MEIVVNRKITSLELRGNGMKKLPRNEPKLLSEKLLLHRVPVGWKPSQPVSPSELDFLESSQSVRRIQQERSLPAGERAESLSELGRTSQVDWVFSVRPLLQILRKPPQKPPDLRLIWDGRCFRSGCNRLIKVVNSSPELVGRESVPTGTLDLKGWSSLD